MNTKVNQVHLTCYREGFERLAAWIIKSLYIFWGMPDCSEIKIELSEETSSSDTLLWGWLEWRPWSIAFNLLGWVMLYSPLPFLGLSGLFCHLIKRTRQWSIQSFLIQHPSTWRIYYVKMCRSILFCLRFHNSLCYGRSLIHLHIFSRVD